ncbi:MAG: endonuclease/exonuclease/phosphatase family protein [Bacteroidota bacterium]
MKTGIIVPMSALKIILYLFGVIVLLFLIFLLYFTLTEYKPEEKKVIDSNQDAPVMQKDTFQVLIWNIGYCGLGADMSFFYDGGKQVRTSRENTVDNLNGILEVLNKNRRSDFILLQEVDVSSKRSYHINQFDHITNHVEDFYGYFARNYEVQFVPVPAKSPLGKVRSGLANFTRFAPTQVTRNSFPGNYPWPKRLFMLDRCFLVSRHKLPDDAELLVVNTHNSAYDNGRLKKQEMSYLREFLLEEYNKGNYIIAGGDWNQYPPGIDSLPEISSRYAMDQASVIEDDFMPSGWKWMFDPESPTNRALDKPFNENSQIRIIDFFLVSPNITPLKVNTTDLKFEYSDHQPVLLNFKIE